MADQEVTPPSVEEMKIVLARFNAAVDAEDVLAGTVHAAVCTGVLERIYDALKSGEYALVSRAEIDRQQQRVMNLTIALNARNQRRGDPT